jgi:hypothetical protein
MRVKLREPLLALAEPSLVPSFAGRWRYRLTCARIGFDQPDQCVEVRRTVGPLWRITNLRCDLPLGDVIRRSSRYAKLAKRRWAAFRSVVLKPSAN